MYSPYLSFRFWARRPGGSTAMACQVTKSLAVRWRYGRVMMLAFLASCVVGLLPLKEVWAQAVPEPQGAVLMSAMDAAYQDLDMAGEDNTAAIDRAADQYARLLKTYPGHPLVMVYAGASTALRAYTTILPWKKIQYVEDGLALVDKSVILLDQRPDTILPNGMSVALETRFTAAKTQLDLPSFFKRKSRGKRMLEEVLNSTQLASAPLILRGEVWLSAGMLAIEEKRTADARNWFKKVVEARTPQAAKAQARLKEIAS